jgi:hypothetical protein
MVGKRGLADMLAGNLALDSVCWAALSPDGLVAYMNLYDIVLLDGCVSVSELSCESFGIAADRAAADYGLPSAESVTLVTLSNADFLLATYGDSDRDGFCAVNYLFVWNGRLAGLEFVSTEPLTPEELDMAGDVAASLSGELLFPPLRETHGSLPVGSELAWEECALGGGSRCRCPTGWRWWTPPIPKRDLRGCPEWACPTGAWRRIVAFSTGIPTCWPYSPTPAIITVI